jgi:hypothetical protein
MAAFCAIATQTCGPLQADDEKPAAETIELAEGKMQLTAPESWKKTQPATNIVEYEFAVDAAEGDAAGGRLTIMGAGGSVEQNIERWEGQFSDTNRSDKTKKKVAGCEVHLVDLSGTFKDQRGPFAPATMRKDYRMIAAIIVSEKSGKYFVKLYGPEKTIAANKEAFDKMIDGLQMK